MRIKEIEARLAAIKKEIEERGDAMKAEEIDALENETKELTEERAGLIAAAEKRNGILDNIAKGGGVSVRSGIDWRRPGDCGLCRAEERGGSRGELAGVRRESGGSLRGEKL